MKDTLKAWGFLVLLGGIFYAAASCMAGCATFKAADNPDRATARAIILTISEAVHQADVACGQYALAAKDAAIARRCADAYDVARNAALSASFGVDAWDDATQGRIACAAVDAVQALGQITAALEGAQVTVPAAARDAVQLAEKIGKVCHG